MNEICYLCGAGIDQKDRNADHVPPKQIFPTRIRKKYNLSKLRTLPTHKLCNSMYQSDEDYFHRTIGIVDNRSQILEEVWYDIEQAAQKMESRNFHETIFNQIELEAQTPGGIIIPGKVAIKCDGDRINRIVWKILRGLFFLELARFLPEATPHFIHYFHDPNLGLNPPPVVMILEIVRNSEERGEYKGVFSYKYVVNPEQKNIAAWLLLFWDRHMFMAGHHDPSCDCNSCLAIHRT